MKVPLLLIAKLPEIGSMHSPRHIQSFPAVAGHLSKFYSPCFGGFRFGRFRSDFFFNPTATT